MAQGTVKWFNAEKRLRLYCSGRRRTGRFRPLLVNPVGRLPFTGRESGSGVRNRSGPQGPTGRQSYRWLIAPDLREGPRRLAGPFTCVTA